MATCPSGHESASDDFCDVCGIRIGGPAGFAPVAPAAPAAAPPGAPAPGGACPRCSAPRTGQFCEQCGYDFKAAAAPAPAPAPSPSPAPPAPPAPSPSPAPPPPPDPQAGTRLDLPVTPPPVPSPPTAPFPPSGATWSAVVTADRGYFDRVVASVGPDAPELSFPAYCPERRFRLSGTEVRIGRRSVSRGIDPEIDLTGPPSDPGVSRLHALLVAEPDGSWSVVDPGSENGTLVNGNEIAANQAIPLHEGDRIHLGAWTALTITREG